MKISKLISTLIIVSLTGIQFSCDELITLGQYIEFTVNGKTFKEKIPSLLNASGTNNGCANTLKKTLLSYSNSGFELNIEMIHDDEPFELNFLQGKKTTDLFDQTKAVSGCHLDLVTQYTDKSENQGLTTLKTGTTTIISVEDADEDDEDLTREYKVIGEFSGIFATASGKESQITGYFVVKVSVDEF